MTPDMPNSSQPRRPKGTPTGGQFDRGAGGGAATNLEPIPNAALSNNIIRDGAITVTGNDLYKSTKVMGSVDLGNVGNLRTPTAFQAVQQHAAKKDFELLTGGSAYAVSGDDPFMGRDNIGRFEAINSRPVSNNIVRDSFKWEPG